MIPGFGRSPRGGHGNPLQHSCLENHHGQRGLAGYSPWGHKESDTTQHSTAQQQGKASEFAFPTSSGWCCCFSGIAVRTSAPQCGTQRLLGYFCSPVSCDGSSASSGGPSSLWADLPYMEFVTPTLAGSQNPWQVQILEVRIISYLRLAYCLASGGN